VAGVKSHEKHFLGKQCSYLHQNLSKIVVDNHLHKINPNAQRNIHQSPQGMTENHQKNKAFVGRLVVVIDVNPSDGFWTRRLMKLFGHEGK
jgi:hypothetical protein